MDGPDSSFAAENNPRNLPGGHKICGSPTLDLPSKHGHRPFCFFRQLLARLLVEPNPNPPYVIQHGHQGQFQAAVYLVQVRRHER